MHALALCLAMAVGFGCKPEVEERVEQADDGSVLGPYLTIGRVLADDSVEGLPELAAKVVEITTARESEPGAADMLAAAGRVGSPDIATARLMYKKMSEGAIAWLAANPDERKGLVLVHCPMTFANQGAYWVQREGEILNPFEGSMMLHCGAKLAWEDHRANQPPAGAAAVEGMEP